MKIFNLFIAAALCVSTLGAFDASAAVNKRVVTDMLGRKVEVPAKVKRIVAIGGALRLVVYMQAFDQVVGIEEYEKRRPFTAGKPYSVAIRDKVDSIPSVGEGWPRPVDFEKIIAVKPEVILIAGADDAQVTALEQKTRIPVVVLSYGGDGVYGRDAIIKSLRLLGSILDREKRAEEIAAYIESIEKDLAARSKGDRGKAPAVYAGCISFRGTHGITSTEAHYPPLEMVGATNVVNSTGKKGHLFIDKEKLLVWNPDVIFVDAGGLDILKQEYAKDAAFYKGLKAVREGKVYLILPYNYYYTNIEVALANAYFAGSVLYPEKYRGLDPVKKADEILRFFTGPPSYAAMKKEYGGYGRLDFSSGGIDVR